MFASAGILFAFEHTDVAGKAVLLALLVGSIFSWSIIIAKYSQLRAARKATRGFLNVFRSSADPLEAYLAARPAGESPQAAVYQAGAKELCFHLTGSSTIDSTLASRITSARPIGETSMNSVRSAMERAVGEESLRLESNLS